MQIDITRLLLNQVSSINVDSNITIPNEKITDIRISFLKNIHFNGKILLTEDNTLFVEGILAGIMILKDDITLETVDYEFTTDIEEIIEEKQNKIDLTEIIWQNIVLSVPSKVRKNSEEVYLSGDGWRVISEERYNAEKEKNNPFSNLSELLKTKEDK